MVILDLRSVVAIDATVVHLIREPTGAPGRAGAW
jgi:hypothetical protein